MGSKHFVLCAVLLTLAAPLARAQEEPPPAAAPTGWAALQTKNVMADEDKAALKALIAPQIEAIQNGAGSAAAELRANFAKGTNAFKEAFAALVIEAVSGAYKSAKEPVAAQLVALAASLNEAPTYKLLVEALHDERPAIRTAAAAGLRDMRAKLALAGGTFVSETIEGLREAGKRESSEVALKAIYQALDFPAAVPNPPDPKLNLSAVLDILETRGERYFKREPKGTGADVLGVALAGRMRTALNDAERDRLAVAVGRMMFYSIAQYRGRLHAVTDKSGDRDAIDTRNSTELLIEQCEKELKELLKPATPPDVTKRLREGGEDRLFAMLQEATKWQTILQDKTGQKFWVEEPGAEGESKGPDGG